MAPLQSFKLKSEKNGYWWCTIHKELEYDWYDYHIEWKRTISSDYPKRLADPYSVNLSIKNSYQQPAKSAIPQSQSFNWGNDDFVVPANHRELTIYELHIKDAVALSDPQWQQRGCYKSFISDDHQGGLNHLKKLGVNAVEFLPLQQYARFEPPFGQRAETSGLINDWNPSAINHWGYMTSNFFAPDSRYASDGSNAPDAWSGQQALASREFKQLVKTLHQEGIAVIMDVVFNHVSHHDYNPLRYLAPEVYLRHKDNGQLANRSGCGNDFKSESGVSRKLILEAIRYWMTEYHIDGFRFDLAHLLDWKTINEVKQLARSINPNVIMIAEPWGGGYNPLGFSNLGWSCWNDRFRNTIKGTAPRKSKGVGFGHWSKHTPHSQLDTVLQGSLDSLDHGIVYEAAHSINYLDSHDGFTLGDFIRQSYRSYSETYPISDISKYLPYSNAEERSAKLMAMILMLSPGIPMIHAGQEWGHAKIISPTYPESQKVGYPDPNSYNKDDSTNYLNFEHISLNRAFFEWYKSLIQIRRDHKILNRSELSDWNLVQGQTEFQRIFTFRNPNIQESLTWLINMDAHQDLSWAPDTPQEVLFSTEDSQKKGEIVQQTCILPPLSSVLLIKLRD
ncbi:MAG: alpha-amylase family glycosyl hydrolase [Bacteroidota bacterium]